MVTRTDAGRSEAHSRVPAQNARPPQVESTAFPYQTDQELVRELRKYLRNGNRPGAMAIFESLLLRCRTQFWHHAYGLPRDLRQDAVSGMQERLLKELFDENEVFPEKNFIHYLACLCIDEFNSILRQEGRIFQRDGEGRPVGRPLHIPRVLMSPIPTLDSEGSSNTAFVDQADPYEHLHGYLEGRRILMHLEDPLDRRIVILHVIEGLTFEEIGVLCHRSKRTAWGRYNKAISSLRAKLLFDAPANSLCVKPHPLSALT